MPLHEDAELSVDWSALIVHIDLIRTDQFGLDFERLLYCILYAG